VHGSPAFGVGDHEPVNAPTSAASSGRGRSQRRLPRFSRIESTHCCRDPVTDSGDRERAGEETRGDRDVTGNARRASLSRDRVASLRGARRKDRDAGAEGLRKDGQVVERHPIALRAREIVLIER
jgi:hypothetical protein